MTRETWIRDGLRPACLTVMAACVAWSVAEFIQLIWPTWNLPWTVIACTLAAIEAHLSYRILHTRPLFMADRWRVRTFEVAFLFVLVKAGLYLGQPLEIIAADLRTWVNTPIAILDPQTLINFLLALGVMFAVTDTTQDLETMRDPEAPLHYLQPRDRLMERYFFGGLLLLFTSGLARIGFSALLDLGRGAITGLVLNALFYFMVGLVLLAQANYAHWAAVWQNEGTPVHKDLAWRWARHSLIFMGLIAVIAFALPTFYGFGLLGVLGALLSIVSIALYAIIFLFSALIAGLLSFLFPGTPPTLATAPAPTPIPTPVPTPLPPAAVPLPPDPIWEFWRSTTFWIFIALLVAYILFEYLNDRPELVRALRNARLLRGLKRLWESVRATALSWLQAMQQAVREAQPLERLRQWLSRAPLPSVPFWNLRRASPREQIWYYYLSTLRRAAQLGFGRAPAQTPDEYDPQLEAQLTEARAEVRALTEAFDHARYSAEPVEKGKAQETKALWERVRAALQRLRQARDDKQG